MRKLFPLFFICLFVIRVEAQKPADSTVSFWSAVTPTKRHPADPRKIGELSRWCQQHMKQVVIPCPEELNTVEKTNPAQWFYPVFSNQYISTPACIEKQLRSINATSVNVHDASNLAALILKASYYVQQTKYGTAREYSERAVRLADSLQIFQGWSKLILSRALFGQETNFPRAYSLLNQSLALARKENDLALEAYALSALGMINRRVYFGASLKAIPYHQSALKIGFAQKDTVLIAQELLALSLNYDDAGRIDKHVDYLLQLIPLVNNKALPRIKARLFLMTGRLLPTSLAKFHEPFVRESIRLSQSVGELFYVEYGYQELFEILMEKKQTQEATQVLEKIDSLSQFLTPHRSYSTSTNLLWYQLAKRNGNVTNALTSLEKEYQNVSQRYQTQNAAALSQWEAIFHNQEQNLLLKQQEEQQHYLVIVIVLVTLLLLTAAVALYFQGQSQRATRHQMALTAEQADQLRQLDTLKSQFFANVSHELRTPLTLILGPLGSLLKQTPPVTHQAELLRTADQNARRLLELVNEIMDLTKLDAGKLDVVYDAVRVNQLMSQIVANFEPLAQQSAVHLKRQFGTKANLQIALDVNKFQKIIDNLLINAFRFTPSNGQITVKTSENADWILVEVQDTGRGIHPGDLPHVFDRYFQTQQPGTPSEGGTGIGLALAAEFTRLLGGKIWVESQWQQGACFYVEIPKRIVTPLVTQSDRDRVGTDLEALQGNYLVENHPETRRESVLLVEDDQSLRQYLTTILQPSYTVLTVQNGQEALDLLASQQQLPALIISDLMMPVMDGFQLLTALKNADTYRHIPVLMLTARTDKSDKLQALRIGVDDYIVKPFDEDELMARVTNLVTQLSLRLQSTTDSTPEPIALPVITSSNDINWLERLERYVEQELGNFDLTADLLADLLSVSRSTLFREVKRLTGLTPAQYIMESRLQQARFLLENRKVSTVKEVAQRVGLRQVKHFSLTFKNRFGKLPSEYLKTD